MLLATIIGVVALGPLGVAAGAGFTDDFSVPGADSQAAADLLGDKFPAQAGEVTQVVVAAEDNGAFAPDGLFTARATESFDALASIDSVLAVTPPQVSSDGRTAFVSLQHDAQAQDLPVGTYVDVQDAMAPAEQAGLEVSYRGNLVALQGDQPAPVGELLGIVAGIVILTLLFRSAVAMAVALVAAVVSVVAGTVVLTVASAFFAIPTVAPTLVVMLGLGAGIDYALFMVARFRDRLRHGEDVVTAAGRAAGSTGVAVLMAGVIVVVSISALFVTGIPLISRMGLAAGLVVAICALASVTLVPALLALAGRRVLPRAERRSSQNGDQNTDSNAGPNTPPHTEPDSQSAATTADGASREVDTPGGLSTPSSVRAQESADGEGRRARALARAVTGRPILWTLAASVVLLALAAPALNLELGNPDDGTRPVEDTRRVAYDRLAEGFGPGFNGPLLIAVDLAGDDQEDQRVLDTLTRATADQPGVVSATPAQVNDAGDAAVLSLIPDSKPQDAATSDLVDTVRSDIIPAAVSGTSADAHVGGVTATFDDLAQTVADRLWLLITVVVGLSLILLTVLFRSIWLPLVSAAFNLLSIGAAYGVVTLAFQTTTGADLLGVAEQPIISFVPMLMFAILFGLSMDYNVFLLSRVREQWLTGLGARPAVLSGIGQTAGVIGAAGAIMTLVFSGFLLEDAGEVKMIGLGLGVAVLIDVTLVRLVLSPAVLHLLGEHAWWFPKALARLPRLDLEH